MINDRETSWDTNEVNLELANNEYNYNFLFNEGERLLVADDYDLKVILKTNCLFNSDIDWGNVDAKEVREEIASLQRGE